MRISKLNFFIISLLFLGLGISFVLTYSIMREQDKALVRQRDDIVLALATEIMSPDLKAGLRGEVYRKCKSLFNKHSLSYIHVKVLPDEEVCNFGNRIDNVSVRKLYFGPDAKEELGSVEIAFDSALYADTAHSQQILLFGLLLLVPIIFAWVTRQVSLIYLSKPVLDFNALLSSNNPDEAILSLKKRRYRLVEIENLRINLLKVFDRATLAQELESKIKVSEARGQIASQVAHDIRSPLAALDMVNGELAILPEDLRLLMRGAVGRIKDICNNLLLNERKTLEKDSSNSEKSTTSSEPKTTVSLLSSLIEPLISEKRLQFRAKLEITINANLGGSYGLFAKVDPIEFKRVLSNLINNSAEAIDGRGDITLSVLEKSNWITVCCEDNGKGIPSEILATLGRRGGTYGKEDGSGLGLFHAKTCVENWGGSLSFESAFGKGCKIIIKLQKATPPSWFVPELIVRKGSTITILDDDSSIHQIWSGRFEKSMSSNLKAQLKHFSTGAEFSNWIEANKKYTEVIHLIDFELIGESKTGLDLIETLDIGSSSILVTSRYEEEKIRSRCEKLKVRLIPKGIAAFVPIILVE